MRDELVLVISEGAGGQLLVQQDQPATHLLEQLGFESGNKSAAEAAIGNLRKRASIRGISRLGFRLRWAWGRRC